MSLLSLSSIPLLNRQVPSLKTAPPSTIAILLRGVTDFDKMASSDPEKLLHEMRAKVANSVEEVFVLGLMRLNHPDTIVCASVLATEIEEKLYKKYKKFKISDADFKTQYKKQQLSLLQVCHE